MKEYCVYVLETPDGKMYVGLSSDVDKRFAQHRNGEVATTRKMGQWQQLKLRHFWKVPTYSLASRFERYLHDRSKSEVLEIILDCPYWNSVLQAEAETKILQFSEVEIEKTGKQKIYENAYVSLPNKDQLRSSAK